MPPRLVLDELDLNLAAAGLLVLRVLVVVLAVVLGLLVLERALVLRRARVHVAWPCALPSAGAVVLVVVQISGCASRPSVIAAREGQRTSVGHSGTRLRFASVLSISLAQSGGNKGASPV